MRKRKTSVATKIIGILIGLGVITGLMCFLNLMTYDVLEGYNLSLQKTVVDLENATEADATALAEEANYLLERIDVKIRGTYVFDIVLIVIFFIVTIVAIVISLRMIAKPLKQVSQTLNESKSVGKIQELTTGILEIARQTNLLALMKMGEKANIAIVDSISMLSQLSEEVSAGTASSKETLNGTMEKMQGFSDIVQNTFKQLLILEETTTE